MRCVEQSAILFKVLFNYIAIVYLSVLDGRAQFPLFDVSVRRSTHGDVERFRAYY